MTKVDWVMLACVWGGVLAALYIDLDKRDKLLGVCLASVIFVFLAMALR